MKKILLGFIAIGLLTFVGCEKEKQKGCTEPNAINFDSAAEENDGSCRYEDNNNNGSNTDQDSTGTNNGGTETDTGDGGTDTDSTGTTVDDDGTDTDSTETSSDDGGTDSDTGDGTTDTKPTSSSVEYGEGATDVDGNTYKSVIIGEQEWFAENLKTSKYNDGTSIPNITDNTAWSNLSTGAWCNYDNDNQYDSIYGKLYNWYAVETGKLCPTGWHVPTDAEWTVLSDYLSSNGHNGTEGTALKATSGWNGYEGVSGNGTDDYGWNGLPGGARISDDYFVGIDSGGIWWSSVKLDTDSAYFRSLYHEHGDVYRSYEDKKNGFSDRCLRD